MVQVRNGGFASISAVLSDRVGNLEVQRAVTGVLWNLAADTTLHNGLVADSPSILDKLLLSMDAHPLSSVVQEQGCGFLWSLLSQPDTRLRLNAPAVSACLTRVLRAMQLHVSSPEVQEAACAALCNLLSCDHIDVTTLGYKLATTVVPATATTAATTKTKSSSSTMTPPGSPAGVRSSPSKPSPMSTPVMSSIGDVTSTNDVCSVALSLGAVARVVHCMDAHRSHAGVQEKACLALWSLTTPLDAKAAVHPIGKPAAVKAGAVGRVMAARQRFPANTDVVSAADGALALLMAR